MGGRILCGERQMRLLDYLSDKSAHSIGHNIIAGLLNRLGLRTGPTALTALCAKRITKVFTGAGRFKSP